MTTTTPGPRASGDLDVDLYGAANQWPRRRRRPLFGWVALLVCAALLIGYYWWKYRGDMAFQDVTIETWACPQPLDPEASADDIRAAGCRVGDVDARIEVMHAASVLRTAEGDGWSFVAKEVPTASPEMALKVTFGQPMDVVILADSFSGLPQPVRPMNSDASGTVWTQHFALDRHNRFTLVTRPRE